MASEYFRELASFEEVMKKASHFNVEVYMLNGSSEKSTNMPIGENGEILLQVLGAIPVEPNDVFFIWNSKLPQDLSGLIKTLTCVPANQIKKIVFSLI